MEEKNKKKVFMGEEGNKNSRNDKKKWAKPTLEDVSGQVMAQPYIRFT